MAKTIPKSRNDYIAKKYHYYKLLGYEHGQAKQEAAKSWEYEVSRLSAIAELASNKIPATLLPKRQPPRKAERLAQFLEQLIDQRIKSGTFVTEDGLVVKLELDFAATVQGSE